MTVPRGCPKAKHDVAMLLATQEYSSDLRYLRPRKDFVLTHAPAIVNRWCHCVQPTTMLVRKAFPVHLAHEYRADMNQYILLTYLPFDVSL